MRSGGEPSRGAGITALSSVSLATTSPNECIARRYPAKSPPFGNRRARVPSVRRLREIPGTTANLVGRATTPGRQVKPQGGEGEKTLLAAIAVLAAALIVAPAASAIDKVKTGKLRKGVTVDGILKHERALQDIAIANDGNRAATTPGYDASVKYVANRLRRAGYRVSLDPFNFPTWTKNGPSTLTRTDGTPVTYAEDTDYIVSQFSGSGDVSGPIFVAGNTALPLPPGGRAPPPAAVIRPTSRECLRVRSR